MGDKFYRSAKLSLIETKNASIALTEFGAGDNVFFIHGFPTHGYTWRKILPAISKKYKCNVVDLPGLGNSRWTEKTDFNTNSQANYMIGLIESMGIKSCTLIAHDSGATVARVIAINKPDLIEKLVVINTEIPNHRPPWIQFYQKVGLLPFMPKLIQNAVNWSWFIKSPMGFKEAYSDKNLLNNPDNLGPYLKILNESKYKTIGAFKYLKGIDWKIVDEFQQTHKSIKAKTLLIWGEDDKTFPVDLAEKMMDQFSAPCKMKRIRGASLLPHEEKSDEVGDLILEFLEGSASQYYERGGLG